MPASPTRVAIVTGGSKGMGRHMAEALIDAGHRVAVVDIDQVELDALATRWPQRDRFLPVRANLADLAETESVVPSVLEHFGRVDILVNNAGIGQASLRPDNWVNPIRFWEVSPEQLRLFISINFQAPFVLSRAAVTGMLAQGWGRIVNVTTSLDTMLRAGFLPYGPTKAATESATAIMAGDLGTSSGVTANVLVPGGPTDTGFIPSAASFDRSTMLRADVLNRPLLWLVSDAAQEVTGQRLIAAKWRADLPAEEACGLASAPAAWGALGNQMIKPQWASETQP